MPDGRTVAVGLFEREEDSSDQTIFSMVSFDFPEPLFLSCASGRAREQRGGTRSVPFLVSTNEGRSEGGKWVKAEAEEGRESG